jgi:hypothetical protein
MNDDDEIETSVVDLRDCLDVEVELKKIMDRLAADLRDQVAKMSAIQRRERP